MVRHGYDISAFPAMAEMMKKADIRNDAGFLKKDNKVWHFHPVYFLNHLEKFNQSFNPYYGKAIDLGGKIVVDNPGFAVLDKTKTSEYTYNDMHFTKTNGVYNEDYKVLPQFKDYEKYFHEGVDFYGEEGDTIVSLISARVVTWGWYGPYGQAVLLANEIDIGMYLLGHLFAYKDDIKEGMLIAPGEAIGKVGGSASNAVRKIGTHLHVTYYNQQYNPRITYINKINATTLQYVNALLPSLNNPFNHNDIDHKGIKK
jgi:murein DD-endopeptidase MepM/ murein hydrolase activator NlpD